MLKEYAAKRRFSKTPEPGPSTPEQDEQGPLTFVVQKHAATRLHYDLRLEHNGVLVSWAVPKGPSLNPEDKRLAVHVEDHPFGYGSFEGTIPKGEYGGGQVIVWDRGVFLVEHAGIDRASQEAAMEKGLAEGKLDLILDGHKLKGGWILIHTRENQWLFLKRADEYASDKDVLEDGESVLSGSAITDATPRTQNDVVPMLLSEADKPFSSTAWTFEPKMDGVRAIAEIDGTRVKLFTRNRNDVTGRLPEIVSALTSLSLQDTILDGEVVLLDENGRPSFQNLMENFQAGLARGVQYYVFDVIRLKGQDLRRLPWSERREKLESLDLGPGPIRLLDTYPEEGEMILEHVTKIGLEGVVAKRIKSTYQSGVRTKDWLKIKLQKSDEFVVGGFSKGKGGRASTFGALLLGEEGPNGLRYVGNVGGGFSDNQLEEIRAKLETLRRPKSPFVEKPNVPTPIWVEPTMVAEVRFTNRTKEGSLRFPIFLRMRPDKTPSKPADPLILALVEILEKAGNDALIQVEGHQLKFSNLDKELWPGITKRELACYYARASGAWLPHLKERPISFVRCPDGVQGPQIFQRHLDRGRPAFMDVVSVFSESEGGAKDFLICNNLPTLLWMAQNAALEIHPWNATVGGDSSTLEGMQSSMLNHADRLVFDLDPHFGGKASGFNKENWDRLVEVGLELRELLDKQGLKCFAKSSGKSGLHVYLPIIPDHTHDEVRAAARVFGEQLEAKMGKKVTLVYSTKKRPDAVFIDVNQNVRGKTMGSVYSPRLSLEGGVSMPIAWDELTNFNPQDWTPCTAAGRIEKLGDLWAEMTTLEQSLPTP